MLLGETPVIPTITYTFTQASDGTKTVFNANSWPQVTSMKVDGVAVPVSKTINVTAGEHTIELVVSGGVFPSYIFNSIPMTEAVLTGPWVTIGDYSFFNNNSLVNLTLDLPDLTSLLNMAFRGCSSMVSVVNFPSLATLTGSAHFYNTKITKIQSLGSITTIPQYMFGSCKSLTEVTLPSTLTSIGQQPFAGCSALTTITCLATTPPTMNRQALMSINNLAHIYVPTASVNDYKTASVWSNFASIIEAIPSN